MTNAARGVAREAAREVATTKPVNVPQAAPITAPTTAPTTATIVIQTKRSSLPAAPQMMDDAPRPTFIPAPTPIVKPGQKIIISNGIAPTPQPRENPTIIISNGPKSP